MGVEQSNSSIVIDDTARAQGVPQARAGDQPRARDAALPHAAASSRTSRRCTAGTTTTVRRSPRRSASRSSSSRTPSAAGSSRSTRSNTTRTGSSISSAISAGSPPSCTTCSPRMPAIPAFSPEEPSQESLSLLTATVDEDIERIFVRLPDDERVAPIIGRGQDVRERLAARSQLGVGGRDDPHARRLPPRPDPPHAPRLGDHRLRGRARPGAPGAPREALAAARHREHAALVRLHDLRRARSSAATRRRRVSRTRRGSGSSMRISSTSTRR